MVRKQFEERFAGNLPQAPQCICGTPLEIVFFMVKVPD
jgi:hypothetical protein